jgi:hypothetical protein
MQMAGDILHLPALKAIALATAASPAPKVFSSVRGLETYSTQFYIEWVGTDGLEHSAEITPELNTNIRGPYNRRNVYGAVLAYGPILITDPRSHPMFDSVSRYALCGNAPLLRELDIDPVDVKEKLRIRLQPRPGAKNGNLPLIFESKCP